MFPFPFVTLGISKRWVSTISNSSQALVSPLVDSLRHDLRAKPNPLQDQLVNSAVTFSGIGIGFDGRAWLPATKSTSGIEARGPADDP